MSAREIRESHENKIRNSFRLFRVFRGQNKIYEQSRTEQNYLLDGQGQQVLR